MRPTTKPVFGLVVALGIAQSGVVLGQEYRSHDGTGNNLSHPSWGAAGTALARLAGADYANGYDSVSATRPNPRDISNAIFPQPTSLPDARGLSEWVWVWGQFVDHDLDHTLTSPLAGTLSVPIPAGDPVFGGLPAGSAISVTRASVVSGTGVPGPPAIAREHPNNISAWLDAGMVYGGRAVDGPPGVDRSEWLRDDVDRAKLRTSDGGSLGPLMPKYVHGVSPVMANTNTPGMKTAVEGDRAYVAGDVRANENTPLLVIHTVFVREHNRLVDVMRAADPSLSADELYDRARKIVSAQIQSITYREFLPSLGVTLPTYGGYDPAVNPAIFTEFSNAAFRVPHSQINSQQLRVDASGHPIPEGPLQVADSFFNPDKLLEGGLEPLIRGLAFQVQEANDAKMVDGLRNQLFQIFIPGFGLVDNATDLAAIDILRGRDVGLGSLNDTRAALGLAAYASFAEITSDAALAATLHAVYGGDIGAIDLFVGLLCEDHAAGTSLGPTTLAIYERQFLAIRDGDRFWFENDPTGINADLSLVADWNGTGPLEAREWLQNVRLSEILMLNTGVTNLQENVFFARAVPESSAAALMMAGGLLLLARWQQIRRRPFTG